MNKKLTLIIAIETLLIVALFWVLIFYGKDEYEAYQAKLNEEIESPSHLATKDGVSIVTLSSVIQQNSGISTAKVSAASFKGEQKSRLKYLDLASIKLSIATTLPVLFCSLLNEVALNFAVPMPLFC